MSKYSLDNLKNKVKLVIWDLDDTFWSGTLSEENIELISRNSKIIKKLVDRGIMNSICSNNDFEVVKEELKNNDLWNFFIFPKIDWGPKGEMVSKIIEESQFRPQNVVFIDDNHMNLEEVKYYNPEITVLTPKSIGKLLSNQHFQGKNDQEHSRLSHYKILEKKADAKESFSSNKEFLKRCNIKVDIIKDCMPYLDRITELITRTNQLNFTKNRMNKTEIKDIILNDTIESAIVKVSDDFGDYGIVGFYAMKSNEVIHFVFSCRLLNLEIEQYVYAQLGFPKFNFEGDTAVNLKKGYSPEWINEENISPTKEHKSKFNFNKKINCLIKGGCDLNQTAHYLTYNDVDIITEFNYPTESGVSVHREHTEIIKSIFKTDSETKSLLVEKLPFYDENVFNTALFSDDFDVIIYSVLMDYTQGVYKSTENDDVTIAYGDFNLPLTNKKNWDLILENSPHLDRGFLKWFKNNFEFDGPLSEDNFINNLNWIKEKLDNDTQLILINGSEVNLEHNWERNRYVHHGNMNNKLLEFVNRSDNVNLVDVNKFVTSENDVTNNIRHYKREVYKNISEEIMNILKKEFSISDKIDKKLFLKNKSKQLINDLKNIVK